MQVAKKEKTIVEMLGDLWALYLSDGVKAGTLEVIAQQIRDIERESLYTMVAYLLVESRKPLSYNYTLARKDYNINDLINKIEQRLPPDLDERKWIEEIIAFIKKDLSGLHEFEDY